MPQKCGIAMGLLSPWERISTTKWLSRLFDRFYQGHDETSRGGEATAAPPKAAEAWGWPS